MEVIAIIHNWHQVGSVQDRDGAGENYTTLTVGKDGVVSIQEHKAQGEGDKWNYLVEFESGRVLRIFNPNSVEYSKHVNN